MFTPGVQVQFTDDAYNASGTVYNPDRTTSTGPTVGFFTNEVSGLNLLNPSEDIISTGSTGFAIVYNSSLVVDGDHVGTTLGDTFIRIRHITEEACLAINRGLHGQNILGTYSASWALTDARAHALYGSIFLAPSAINDETYIQFLPGCNSNGPTAIFYYELIQAN